MTVQLEFVGMRFYGPEPLRWIEVCPRRGFTILGGVNGAGKTTLLAAMAEALAGELRTLETAELIFRVWDADAPPSQFEGPSATAVMSRASSRPQTADELLASIVASSIDSITKRPPAASMRPSPEDLSNWADLASEIVAQRLVSLHLTRYPHDSRTTSKWALSAQPRLEPPGTPRLTDFLASLTDKEEMNFLIDGWAELVHNIDLEPGWTRSLIDSRLPIPVLELYEWRPFGPLNETGGVDLPWFVDLLQPALDHDLGTLAAFNRHAGGRSDMWRDSRLESWGFTSPQDTMRVAQAWAEVLTAKAQREWRELRPDQARPLRCLVTHDSEKWLQGQLFEWHVSDAEGQTSYPVHQLSDGQIRWAVLAISLAISDRTTWWRAFSKRSDDEDTNNREGSPLHWWLMDEPELGLHRAAERSVAESLRSIASDPSQPISIVAATHSPAIMAGADTLLRVSSGLDGLVVEEIGSLPSELESMGLEPSDLMGWYRAFVFVEGPHDVAALEGFLGEELADRRIKVLFLGGAAKLAGTLQAQFLLESSDAAVISIIDDISTEQAHTLWEDTKRIADVDGFPATKPFLKNATHTLAPTEGAALREFMATASTHPNRERFAVLGLPRPDVLCYVTPTYLPAKMPATWDEIARRYASDHGKSAEERWKPDKNWLKKAYGYDANADHLPAVVKTMRHSGRPSDFDDLLSAIDSHIAAVESARKAGLDPHRSTQLPDRNQQQ